MRIETIETEKPRLAPVLPDKLDGLLGAPSGLVVLRRRSALDVRTQVLPKQVFPGLSFVRQPLGVGIFLPVRLRMMGPEKIVVPIVRTLLDLAIRTGREVKLTGQTAPVPGIMKELGDQDLVFGNALAILTATGRSRIPARQEGRPTRRAHGALAKRILKTNAFPDETVEDGRLSMGIAQGRDRVVALLIGADPKNVGLFSHHLL